MATTSKLGLCKASKTDREWFGLRELTEYADVSERTLHAWMRRSVDPLPAIRVGGKILVCRSQFEAWLELHRIQPISSVDVDSIVEELVGNTR